MSIDEQIDKAVDIFNQGGIVIFPTDTVFGMGCRIDNEKAIRRLFKMRNRPTTQPVSVLVSSLDMAQKYLYPVPDTVKNKLINKYWPGALTIILPCIDSFVPELVRGGGHTLGIRQPNHKLLLTIIKKLNTPILAPSANLHGHPAPYLIEDVDRELIKKADMLIVGKSSLGQASTVINCSVTPWEIPRQGALKLVYE